MKNEILNLTDCSGRTADTIAEAAEIDRKVYELYGLSDEEIDFIENMSKNH